MLATTYCGEQGRFNTTTGSGSSSGDATPPVVSILFPGGSTDTLVQVADSLKFTAKATDNVRVASFKIEVKSITTGFTLDTILLDSTITSAAVQVQRDVAYVLKATFAGKRLRIYATAVDGAGNTTLDSASVTIGAPPTGSFNPKFNGLQIVAGDSILVGIHATDSAGGIATIALTGFSKRGNPSLGTDTTVVRFNPKTITFTAHPLDTTVSRYLTPVLSDSTPEVVYVQAVLTDAGGNTTTLLDSITITGGPFVNLTAPAAGSRVPVGVAVNVTVSGHSSDSLTYLGFTSRGAIALAESLAVAPLAVTTSKVLVLNTTVNTPLGADTLVPFGVDKKGKRFLGPAIAISFADTVKPTITIISPSAGLPITVGDSILVRVRVQDNRGVTSAGEVGIAHRGVDSLGTGTDVIRYGLKTITLPKSVDTTFSRYILMIPTDSTPEFVRVIVSAQDSSGNVAADSQMVQIVGGPHVSMVRPTAGATTAPGKSVVVQVHAVKTSLGILVVGFADSGVVTARDSIIFSPSGGALPKDTTFTVTYTIPAGTPNGTLKFSPFAYDSLHNVSGVSSGVSITVSSAVVVAVPPTITYNVARRVETGDSITIEATSPAGVAIVGFTAKLLNGTQVSADSTQPFLNGTLTDYTQRFALNLPGPPTLKFPAQVIVTPFAYDSGLTAAGHAVAKAETLTVVAGKTYALPAGSQIVDAIYNKNRNELYLANTALDRVDIFSLAGTGSFVGYVPVGSRPSSLALWPRDSLGNMSDTLIVANSGGTNLSVVDLTTRREIFRQRLPNYIVETVKTQTNAGGGLDIITTPYEFSDRPFQIGAMCVTAGAAKCHHVRVLYSTTPTLGQTSPFPSRGYLAWAEMDSAFTQGLPVHFIYEHAAGGTDTLQIVAVRDTMPGQIIRDTILSVGVGRLVTIATLPFQDSTFVRNSGDALHSIIGEGGVAVTFARALTYDVRPAITAVSGTTCTVVKIPVSCGGFQDNGVSPLVQVSDFVTNRSSRVTAVAINYNGRTNLLRADSIYAFDYTLRQTGIMQVSAANGAVGMDFNPCNNFDATTRLITATAACGASYSPNYRTVFAARPDSSLDVFDTYFYGVVTDTTSTASTIPIPIRNALSGPVRVASTATSTIMFGFTNFGLVVVTLPTVTNSLFPTPQAAPPSPFQLLPPTRVFSRRQP